MLAGYGVFAYLVDAHILSVMGQSRTGLVLGEVLVLMLLLVT